MRGGVTMALRLAVLWGGSAACAATPPADHAERVRLPIGRGVLWVEVARTEAALAQGLMFRRELGENEGMLFVFPAEEVQQMWMANTFVPLSVVFLDGQGQVVSITDMRPLDETTRHTSAGPARFAIEASWGWFAAHGVSPGQRVDLSAVQVGGS